MTPEQFTTQRRALSNRLGTALSRLFQQLGSWRSPDVFVAQAVPLLQGAQQQLAAVTSVWIAQQASQAVGRVLAPPGIPASSAINLRDGVSTKHVYGRPFVTVYTALSRGEPLNRAVELGATRLAEIAELDMQSTYAHAAAAAMDALPTDARPTGWQRVLVGSENCAMCVIASTQRYHRGDLNPIHPACDCRVEPLFGDHDRVLDEALLERAHEAVLQLTGTSDRGGRTPDFRHIQITAQHGELGSLLVRPGDTFTGPDNL